MTLQKRVQWRTFGGCYQVYTESQFVQQIPAAGGGGDNSYGQIFLVVLVDVNDCLVVFCLFNSITITALTAL
jgi:hypothetical protein